MRTTHPPFHLRPVRPEDQDALFDVHASALREYVVATWGRWDEGWQREHFSRHLNLATRAVIMVREAVAGLLDIQRSAEAIMLSNIELAPQFQGLGVGSAILHKLMTEASQQRIPIRLQVLKVNTRARNLYLRFGFEEYERTETHIRMAFFPRTA